MCTVVLVCGGVVTVCGGVVVEQWWPALWSCGVGGGAVVSEVV